MLTALGPQVPTGAVVVGVDGSAQSWHALRWAAQRAGQTGRSLHILQLQEADSLCMDALDIVARNHPDLAVTWSQPPQAAVVALLRASTVASEIVLGTSGSGAISCAIRGSVAVGIGAAAHCPVLITRGATTPAQPRGPVVVGVDPRPGGAAALDFAFAEAERQGVPLTAILCWQLDRSDFASGVPMPGGSMRAAEHHYATVLATALAEPSARHPRVPVTSYVRCARTAGTLVEHSSGAALLVVGSRGRGEVAGLILGSVGQAVMRHSSCPVAIVTPLATADSTVERDINGRRP